MPRLAPLGDSAITIGYGSAVDDRASAAVARDAATLAAAALPGVVEIVPGYVALTIHFQPLEIGFAELRDRLLGALAGLRPAAPPVAGSLVRIAVRYDGPDLPAVAQETGLSIDEVIARHTAVEYRVAMLGFVPGFAYLGPLDPTLALPRRPVPRPRVPAGSVAIGGEQTGVYPAETPGGWHLLGRTPAVLFDPRRSPPALLGPGDRVRFVPE